MAEFPYRSTALVPISQTYPYPASDASSMSSDVASEDGQSCISLADSTYEIVSNHPDQIFDQADESDFTAPDDTGSVEDASELFEHSGRAETTGSSQSALLVDVAETPTLRETQTSLLDRENVPDSAMTSGTIVPPFKPNADLHEPYFQFPSKPEGPIVSAVTPLARHPLRLSRPLRIAYHGPASHKIEILDKIAQAVAASADVQPKDLASENGFDNFSVISLPLHSKETDSSVLSSSRTSFDVTLIPSSGVEIAVQDCEHCSDTNVNQHREDCRASEDRCAVGRNADLAAPSSGDRSSATCEANCHRNGFCKMHQVTEKARSNAKVVPDLAVFYHPASHVASKLDACATSCSYRCSAELSRKGIPVIDIAEDRRFTGDDVCNFNPSMNLATHLIEHPPFGTHTVNRPLDLEAFFALGTMDLNRNIALMTGLHDGPLGLDLPNFRDLRIVVGKTMGSRRLVASTILSSLALTCMLLTAALFGWTLFAGTTPLASVQYSEPTTYHDTAKSQALAHTLTDLRGANPTIRTIPRPSSIEIVATAVAWSVADDISGSTAPQLLRLKTSTDEDYVVSLPEELSSLNRPPQMSVSASQLEDGLEVRLARINASAANIDLMRPKRAEPVKIVVSTGARSIHNFTVVITCFQRGSGAFAVQPKSIHSLAASLFGALDERWLAFAAFEAERMLIMVREWLEKASQDLQDSAGKFWGASVHFSKTARQSLKDWNPLSAAATQERARKSKDAACISRLLAQGRHSTTFAAQLHCESKRFSQELARAWQDKRNNYFPRLGSPKIRSQALFDKLKPQGTLFKDSPLATVRQRAQTLSEVVRRKVDKARTRAKGVHQRSKDRRAKRAERRRGAS